MARRKNIYTVLLEILELFQAKPLVVKPLSSHVYRSSIYAVLKDFDRQKYTQL